MIAGFVVQVRCVTNRTNIQSWKIMRLIYVPREHTSTPWNGGTSATLHQYHDQATIRGSRGSWYLNDLLSSSSLGKNSAISSVHLTSPSSKNERRRGGKTRSRLLSTSTPTDPLPPALTTSDAAQALPSLFASQAQISTTDDDQRRFTSQTSKRPRPSSITSSDTIPFVTLSPPLLNSRSKSSDHQDISILQGFPRKSSTSHDTLPQHGISRGLSSMPAYSSPTMQFVKLDIPSPVDERTDPIITTSTSNLS